MRRDEELAGMDTDTLLARPSNLCTYALLLITTLNQASHGAPVLNGPIKTMRTAQKIG